MWCLGIEGDSACTRYLSLSSRITLNDDTASEGLGLRLEDTPEERSARGQEEKGDQTIGATTAGVVINDDLPTGS